MAKDIFFLVMVASILGNLAMDSLMGMEHITSMMCLSRKDSGKMENWLNPWILRKLTSKASFSKKSNNKNKPKRQKRISKSIRPSR